MLALVFVALMSGLTVAQDAGLVLRTSVGYRTMKNSVTMSDETRKLVEDLEAKARVANNDKKYGEALKHMTHGMYLMRNRKWTPAVALTAFGRAEDRLRALQAGFQMHVPKPVEPTELMVVIASLTGRAIKPSAE